MLTMLTAACAAAAIATSAGAVTTTTSVQGPDGAGQTILFNFNTGTPSGLTGNFSITTGSVGQLAAAPFGDLTPYLVVPGTNQPLPGTATLSLGAAYSNLSFYWGSIDSYNNVTFFSGAGGTGTNLGTISGANIVGATDDGAQGTPANSRRVFFTFGGATAQSAVFNSTGRAFEIDDVSTAAVPEPTIWATLIAGFGLVGFSMRRRRSSVVTA